MTLTQTIRNQSFYYLFDLYCRSSGYNNSSTDLFAPDFKDC